MIPIENSTDILENIDIKTLKNFDIQKESKNLLSYSQEIINQYDTLIYRLKSLIESIDLPLNSELIIAFNDIINTYYLAIESKRLAINTLGNKVKEFNKIYNIKKFNKFYDF